jgi:hypothetical protein
MALAAPQLAVIGTGLPGCGGANHGRERVTEFKQYRRKQIAELRPYVPGEVVCISISKVDSEAGSPKAGDMIARNPKNHRDQWLVAAQYFADNFEPHRAAEERIMGENE